jgi:hypothetical protein
MFFTNHNNHGVGAAQPWFLLYWGRGPTLAANLHFSGCRRRTSRVHDHQLVVLLEDGDTSNLQECRAREGNAGVARRGQRQGEAGGCEARAGAEVAELQQQGQRGVQQECGGRGARRGARIVFLHPTQRYCQQIDTSDLQECHARVGSAGVAEQQPQGEAGAPRWPSCRSRGSWKK